MALKNSEKGVEINFKTVEKEDEEVDEVDQVRFFFRRMYLIRIRKSGYHNILRILKSGISPQLDLTNPDYRQYPGYQNPD